LCGWSDVAGAGGQEADGILNSDVFTVSSAFEFRRLDEGWKLAGLERMPEPGTPARQQAMVH
jgi:hypothetical protein